MSTGKARRGSYVVTKPTVVALRMVRAYVVDTTIRWAREAGYCDDVEDALVEVFGTRLRPATGWRDSDGLDCAGYDVDGFDEDGFDKSNFDRDGFHRHSDRDRENYDREGYGYNGYNRDGVNRDGNKRGHLEELVAGLSQADRREMFRLLNVDYRGQ